MATSLGLGTLQINGGMNEVFGIPLAIRTQLLIIVIVTLLYMTSALTGINRGDKTLSNINITIAIFLLVFVLLLGPTVFILDTFTLTLGDTCSTL